MSMISVQIDELRDAARGQKAMGLFELAQMLNDAADTIWHLRDDLQRANADNAKLREQVSSLVGRSFRTADKMSCIEADNAKLRELVKRMFDRVNYRCRCCSVFCSDWDEDNECCVFTTLMRELGIEV